MKFTELFRESHDGNDDHEYWKSMPHEHLHSEMHNAMKSYGLDHVGSRENDHYHEHEYHTTCDPFDLEHHEETFRNILHSTKGLGWKRDPLGDHIHVAGEMSSYTHPNGSRMHFDTMHNEEDDELHLTVTLRHPK